MNKKLLTLFICLLPMALLAGSGDVNDDGKINVADIVEIVNYIEGHASDNFKVEEADANADGSIDYEDVDALADVIMAGNDYIKVSPRVITITNDKKEFNVVLRTDLDPYNIWVNEGDAENYSLVHENPEGADGVYIYHFLNYLGIDNYSGEDWEKTVKFYCPDTDIRDSVKVIFKSDEVPQITLSPKELVLENKQYGRIAYIDMDYNYEWILYEPDIKITGNEDNWITRTWIEGKRLGIEYDENYTADKREAKIIVGSQRCDASDEVTVSIESGGLASLSVSPKKITVKNKDLGRDILIEHTSNPEWLEVQVEYEGNEEGWLQKNGDFHFTYSENYTGEDRVGKIIFKNEKYNLREEVEVISQCADWVEILPDDLPDRWVRAQKREYNLIGIGSKNVKRMEFNMVLRTGGIENQEDIGCEILEGDDWLELGPITMLGCYFSYTRNYTTEVKTAKVRLYDKKDGYEDVVTINSLPINFQHVNDQNHVYIQPGGDEIEFILYNGKDREVTPEMEELIFTDIDELTPANGKYAPFIHHVSSEVVGNDLHIKLSIDPNQTDEHRWQYVNFPVRYTEGSQKLYIGQAPKSAPTAAQMRQALTDLYNSTNGPNWYRNENWTSTLPLSQWDFLGLAGLGDYVWAFDLNGNTMVGTIPESFGAIMEIENTWRIDHNGLYGRIPSAVINHPMWQEKGWSVVVQDLFRSERRLLEYDDLKLKLPTYEIDHVNGDLKTSNELFAKNKVNVVMIGTPSEEMANLHLSYHNKGYGTIVSSYGWLGGKREDSEKAVEEFPIKDIDFVWNCSWADDILFGLRTMGTWYVFDDQSNLLACYVRDWDIPEEWYASKVDSICRKYLGEPEAHEAYHEYASTDYSKDGVVKQLQAADPSVTTKGIDLVFLGECFTDKDMDDGGEYDQQIAEAVEQFFDEEPYKSLRNRFNVWQVKCVAEREAYGNVSTYAIKENDAKAFEYAKKAIGEDAELMFVNVIYKGSGGTTLDVNRSHTSMYYGSYVAYNYQGGRVINHEGGGHGFALLADEYVEPGNEETVFDEGSCNYIDMLWETYGYGANVDWRSNPSKVKWSQFINDERYADEHIGIYEGAHLAGKGCYRPTENSMMRFNDCGFNAPSREAIYKRVMKLSEGDSWTYDYETFVAFDAPAREAYKAAQARSRARGNEAQQRRIESRPPTIYKGTWRDAGKCEKLELFR